MFKKFLLPIILTFMLVLSGYASTPPATAPAPGKGKSAAAQVPKASVIKIVTAPKDVKQTTVGKNGEIEIPLGGAAGSNTQSAILNPQWAQPPVSDQATTPKSEEAKASGEASDSGQTDDNAGSDAAASSSGSSGSGGSSGSSDAKSSGSSNPSSSSGQGDMSGGIPVSGTPTNFSDNTPVVIPFSNDTTSSPDTTTVTVTVTPTVTPSLPTAELQALLDLSVSDGGIPGAVMAVQSSAGTWIGASGKADLGDATQNRDPENMTTGTQVRIAGVTRLFTAALIMKLVEDGTITLDDTVEKWLGPGSMPTGGENITVRMLLNHTSGLHDHETTPEFRDLLYGEDPALPWDPFFNILPIIGFNQVDFVPGKEFKFCNSNYFVLGMIAEAATSFSDFVENMIQTSFFGPLDMSRTALPSSGLQTPPFSRGYCWFGEPVFGQTSAILTDTSGWDLSFDWTNGSGVSTAQDMLTFTEALFGGQVVNRQSLTQMTTPQAPATDYGYGLQIVTSDPWFGEKVYESDGLTPGAYARWLYYPNSARTIFIAFNRADKRFNTDPAPNPAPSAPQVDAAKKADAILTAASTLIKATQ